MAKFSDLITYFSGLATKHKSIGHSAQEKHFFRFEIDEVLAGINRSDVNYPMLILEGYNFDFTDDKSDNVLKNRHGAFVLLDHVKDVTDYAAIHDKWDALEVICDDILAKIKADKRNPLTPVVRSFDLSSIEVYLIKNEINNTVGMRVLFALTSPQSMEVNASRWLTT